jgi:hypothetical protein
VTADLTDSEVVFAQWTVDTLSNDAFMATNGIKQVIYGDQSKIPVVPMVCVEPSGKRRDFNGLPRKTQIDFEVYVIIYHGGLRDTQANRKAVDLLAEAIELRLHAFPTCGGLVISSLVSTLESGVANKGGALMRATRLTWTARSQVMLPLYDPANP